MTYDKNPSIHIQNSDLTCEKTVKLLGIETDYQLNFDKHIRVLLIDSVSPDLFNIYVILIFLRLHDI
jgi:hypothetical protein